MKWWAFALRLTGLGWYVAVCIVIGVAGGAWLDRLTGTKVLFLLLGAVLGTTIAFWGLYKMVRPFLSSYGVKSTGPNTSRGDN